MTERDDTTLYIPRKTKENLLEAHHEVADHPDALPLYATLEAALNALVEDYESSD